MPNRVLLSTYTHNVLVFRPLKRTKRFCLDSHFDSDSFIWTVVCYLQKYLTISFRKCWAGDESNLYSYPYFYQILLMAFLKVLEDGSHMVMMECPDPVNTLLHEFFLWEPLTLPAPKKESKTRPETAKARTDNTQAIAEPSKARPATAKPAQWSGSRFTSELKHWLLQWIVVGQSVHHKHPSASGASC